MVRNHHFAVARRGGAWDVVESAEIAAAKEELRKLNDELEHRVQERTAQLTQALADKEVLFHEVHHRVRNNLHVIQSILNLKARRIDSPELKTSYAEAGDQVRAIGLVHDLLYSRSPETDVDMGQYLRMLAEALVSAQGSGRDIAVQVRASGARLSVTDATPVGLIANEVILNALKHAFRDRQTGEIDITFSPASHGFVLTIQDNGSGIPDCVADGSAPASGLAIVHGLARQLGGSVTLKRANGTTYRVEFPMA